MEPTTFCTAIIPTVGRSTLARAVESVLQQSLPQAAFEILVMNDSGVPLSHADWMDAPCIRVINTNRRERSVARNTGAALAEGKYLHFLDDDDWMLPGAYQHFWELSQRSGAKWLYGMTQLVDRRTNPTIQLRHSLRGNSFLQTMAGEWIPLQASFIERSTFMATGGFNPLLAGPEDIDLLRRITLKEDVDETPNLVAVVIRGEEGSTTDYVHHSQASRMARESILDATGSFQRMRSSAASPFWYGRMARIYLTSTVWNIKHRRVFTAFSRFAAALASIALGKMGLFTKSFWQAVKKPYASITFEKGIEEARGKT
jgi:glycosyltransferase involved in cell wall biosynthesis